MPPIINFKICDNSADCNGIAQCPTGVFTWDDDAKTIRIDHTKCVECGACADFCSVNAIRYAGNAEELAKIQAEIDADPRTVAELLVDRYGCAPIIDTHSFELSKQKLADRMNTARPVLIEFNTEATIECLLKSVPIAEIQAAFHPDAVYSKFILGEGGGCLADYGITQTPCLRFYSGGKLLGSHDGYVTLDEKRKFLEKVATFAKNI